MTKYVTLGPMQPVGDEHEYLGWSYREGARSLTVHAGDDQEPVFSGLYDARGTKLYRVEERQPFGFPIFGSQNGEAA